LIISVKHLPYIERLKQLQLPTLKYRRLHGDMIEVFKLVHSYYDLDAAVILNYNAASTTRGNTGWAKKVDHFYKCITPVYDDIGRRSIYQNVERISCVDLLLYCPLWQNKLQTYIYISNISLFTVQEFCL